MRQIDVHNGYFGAVVGAVGGGLADRFHVMHVMAGRERLAETT
jgi:hypothetical protein